MNSYAEILEAFDDIKTGNFIRYPAEGSDAWLGLMSHQVPGSIHLND